MKWKGRRQSENVRDAEPIPLLTMKQHKLLKPIERQAIQEDDPDKAVKKTSNGW